MNAEDRARQAVRDFLHVETRFTPAEVIARAIKEAEQDAFTRVLSLLNEHKQCETCVVIDELEDQIKQQMTDP